MSLTDYLEFSTYNQKLLSVFSFLSKKKKDIISAFWGAGDMSKLLSKYSKNTLIWGEYYSEVLPLDNKPARKPSKVSQIGGNQSFITGQPVRAAYTLL